MNHRLKNNLVMQLNEDLDQSLKLLFQVVYLDVKWVNANTFVHFYTQKTERYFNKGILIYKRILYNSEYLNLISLWIIQNQKTSTNRKYLLCG